VSLLCLVYNVGFVYDLIFSCGRLGNYQLQDKMYYDDGKFDFLDYLDFENATKKRNIPENLNFSYAYQHDAKLWYDAIKSFISNFVDTQYKDNDQVKKR